ncbi:MAG: NUDIX hydrolase [Planctomycetota bacterium]|jgi:8-oxo-dGTP pyrophosphatase MutT (NUDIX family)
MKVEDQVVRGRLELPRGDWNSRPGLRDSAVLAILVEQEGRDWLIFNRRRDDLPFHAGQICFPGGAREDSEDAVTCAVRETCEEMGLCAPDLEVLGRLPERVSIAGFVVTPFVARLKAPRPYTLAADEVAEAFEVPCAALLQADGWGYTETRHELARFHKVPFFQYEHHRIWGLTGIILRDFVTQVLGFAPPSS